MFKLVSKFTPNGDQSQAIASLVKRIEEGKRNKYYWERLVQEKLSQLQT